MPVGYFLAHPGGLATEPTSQEVIREVALASMRQAELNPNAPASLPPRPEISEDQREQLLGEGCWVVQNGTGRIDCPSWHPSSQPTPVYQETEDGFVVGMHDPSESSRSGPERRYHFERQADGSYIYRNADGRNFIVIRPDGRMESGQNLIQEPVDTGLVYRVQDFSSYQLPWDQPPLPQYMWREVEEPTREVRVRLAEQTDMANVNAALSGLHQELLKIIERHHDWSLDQQHDFLFRRWDECREDSVGNEARTSIEEFIRLNYLQGTPKEITEAELRAFNDRRRTESQSFCPYGCLPGLELAEPQVGDSLSPH
ncbi:hypothetical protein HZC35_00410 [Candidatus Saganbacteria bacterium]|nr:hypothetical protein [Candidatus Saganbacteria bacterium]